MSSFSEQELAEFKTEATELLDAAEKSLIQLDTGASFKEHYDSIFRCFHNLKGSAGMMELNELQKHTHELENILMSFKEKDSIPKEYVSLFLKGADGCRQILNGEMIEFSYQVEVKALPEAITSSTLTASEAAAESIVFNQDEFIAECEEIIERVSRNLNKMEIGEAPTEVLHEIYRDIHSLKGGAYLFSHTKLGELTHSMESSLEPIRDGVKIATKQLINILFKCIKVIEFDLQYLKKGQPNPKLGEMVLHLTQALGKVVLKNRVSDAAEVKAEKVDAVLNKEELGSNSDASSTIRVSVSLLDNLMALMGEMVLVRNQVLQVSNTVGDQEFINLSKRLNVVTSEMQGELMKTRMQPIGNVLSKFNRVVRDLSQSLGKQIQIHIDGADTELDKSLLESIKDPLTHIVRNACDHGIEKPEIRVEKGKPAGGNIQIRSYHEGGQIIVEVTDDGKGLSKDTIGQKALEKKMISEAELGRMSDKEILNLIFLPGFSTAAVVTNVSGRGVGMDVVKTNIEKIGGTVELDSVEGMQTSIRIKIPLTLAIVPALIVSTKNSIFAVPQVKLVELVRIDQSSPQKIEFLQGMPFYRLRESILPLVDLSQVLKLNSDQEPLEHVNIAVLQAENLLFGLIVDEIQDTADIVVKPLSPLLKSLQLYSGATVLGDGSVALILDAVGLSKVAFQGSESQLQKNEIQLREAKKPSSEIQDYLLLGLNSPTKHAIVLNFVNRIEEFDRSKVEYSGSCRVIRYGATILPLISVNEILGYSADHKSCTNHADKVSVVVIERAGKLYGLEVNAILDTLSSEVALSSSLTKEKGFFGNLNTEKELIVVLDPFELIRQALPDSSPVRAAEQTKRFEVPQVLEGQPIKILFAEDTPFFRKAIVQILTTAGFDVVAVNDGQEALDKLNRDESFHLVISDIEMPKLNGFELAQRIRAGSRANQIPLLAVSSKVDSHYLKKGMDAGFNMYLEKLQSDDLIDAVNSLTRGVA